MLKNGPLADAGSRLFVRANAQYLQAGAAPAYTTGVTIAAWIKPVSFAYMAIINNGDPSPEGAGSWNYELYVTSGKGLGLGYTTGFIEQDTEIGGGSIAGNIWQHVVYAGDFTSAASMYVNGVSKNLVLSGPGSPQTTSSRLLIGSHSTASARFDGFIADIAVWNGILTAAEVASLAFGVLRPNQVRPNLLDRYYPLNEGIGPAFDRAKYSAPALENNGSIIGAEAPPLIRKSKFWPGIDALGWKPPVISTVKFRRTLSPVGTRIGVRQSQGWSQ
jgi:hypothetical protein